MEAMNDIICYELIYAIVHDGMGSKVLRTAKGCGVSGGTILLGKGTICNPILEKLALSDVHKEIVMMVAPREQARAALEKLNKTYKLHKRNHGIAYSIPVYAICGSSTCRCEQPDETGGLEETMYQSIIIIVDKGKAEAVVDAATGAGAKGATIINARGSGVNEISKVFSMEIEPEKEIILMVTGKDQTASIVESIRRDFDIEEPGKGIIFVQNVSKAYGLTE
ncbi:MAG: P-II family nitrogen regulator [Clostridiales bacterium]|nr:P-II family nitrogen regulator [Clostridiales bacterium]